MPHRSINRTVIVEDSRIITKSHIQKRVLFRQAKTLKEGIIEELSPSEGAVMVSGSWHENKAGFVIEFLPDRKDAPVKTKKRSTPFKKR